MPVTNKQDFGTREVKTSLLTEERESVTQWVSQLVRHRTIFPHKVVPLSERTDPADLSQNRRNAVLKMEKFCETTTSD